MEVIEDRQSKGMDIHSDPMLTYKQCGEKIDLERYQ
jgi:hypothetical protein